MIEFNRVLLKCVDESPKRDRYILTVSVFVFAAMCFLYPISLKPAGISVISFSYKMILSQLLVSLENQTANMITYFKVFLFITVGWTMAFKLLIKYS